MAVHSSLIIHVRDGCNSKYLVSTTGTALLVVSLGEGVEEGTSHSDRRSNAAQERQRGLEHDAGSNDDDHAFEGVGNGVSNGGETFQGEERGFVVEIKGQTGE